MTGLDTPPVWWNADTAKPGAGNTGLAASPEGLVISIADVTRHEAVERFKDGCCARFRQEGAWWNTSALRQESEMEPDDIARRFAEYAANQSRAVFNVSYEILTARCESPIEKIMAAGLIYKLRFVWCDIDPYSFHLPRIDYRWPSEVGPSHAWNGDDFDGTYLFAQAAVGKYRVDFLIRDKHPHSGVRFYAIECDGHDYHERTPAQATRDRKRDRWMVSRGITVLRFTGTEICRDIDGCLDDLLDLIGAVPHWAQEGDE